ncbi:hypothetical protein DHEL01_v205805 [Diaporthe helianthi]|uniref:Uncharacterized protein n=1 Tax=Diaporthe helianthi TaxID=158607 RepID=A0A2P5HZY1_DIAHE|nr:hypothetical protein DHEL01_v205805 [Diaporthe helianthi]
MIAVLDTESMLDRIWYTPDLRSSGLARLQFKEEYLVYGPVSGPKYYCVPREEFKSIKDLLGIMTKACVPQPTSYAIDVASRMVKLQVRPPIATLDKILILTAKFVGIITGTSEKLEILPYSHLDEFLYLFGDTLQALSYS